jgi:hypothetical protein
VKHDMKANTGVVELAKVGGKKPKYVDWDTFNKVIDSINAKLDKLLG